MQISVNTVLLLTTVTAAHVVAPRAGRLSPPPGCLSVGASAPYRTVQAAVNGLSKTGTAEQCIFIARGTYREQVYIEQLKSPLVLYGETSDTSSFSANTVTIVQGKSQDDSPNNDGTATLRAHAANLRVYNVNFVNSRGKGSQALALSANNDRQGYYGCQFRGFQDTVLAEKGVQVYAKCYIEGATDFIFGQKARAWFERVDIRVLSASVGYITANGRDSASNPSYYVINNSAVSAASGQSVPAGAYYLGRPWRNYSRVVFQGTSMSNVINSAGWKIWNTGDERTDHVEYGEYGNTGDGSKGGRASFARRLAAPVSMASVLGDDYKNWVDTAYTT